VIVYSLKYIAVWLPASSLFCNATGITFESISVTKWKAIAREHIAEHRMLWS